MVEIEELPEQAWHDHVERTTGSEGEMPSHLQMGSPNVDHTQQRL